MPLDEAIADRIQARLQHLYPGVAAETSARLQDLVDRYGPLHSGAGEPMWSERDAVLITYGDQIRAEGEPPLATLRSFLLDHDLDERLSTVHILPCFPYTSDDGFSVSDYKTIDPALGTWDDVSALGEHVDLMLDLVLNHCSQAHDWFQRFLGSEELYRDYFITVDPQTDLSQVTRPRSHPVLTPFETADGTKHVWTTFSDDQVDLNFSSPDVLVAMLDVLLCYIQHGGRIIRLDAIAYLWKELGTTCIHLPETHEVVKLMRDVLDAVAPGVVLLTETNVPHAENVSYFGDGDEAHMVYQFSLAPLLLDAFLCGDAEPLNNWLTNLEPPRPGTTYFNFTASHDGVGVRPLEGLVEADRFERLVAAVRERGGLVSMKRNPDGSESAYELNVAYFSALGGEGVSTERHVRRFLTSQAVMLALQGIPGIYFHSLVGTPNFHDGVDQTGRARTINRRKFERDELESRLHDGSASQQVFDGYQRLLAVRRNNPAFHPDTVQRVVAPQHPSQIGFWRESPDGRDRVLILANFSSEEVAFNLADAGVIQESHDLLTGDVVGSGDVVLEAESAVWLDAPLP